MGQIVAITTDISSSRKCKEDVMAFYIKEFNKQICMQIVQLLRSPQFDLGSKKDSAGRARGASTISGPQATAHTISCCAARHGSAWVRRDRWRTSPGCSKRGN